METNDDSWTTHKAPVTPHSEGDSFGPAGLPLITITLGCYQSISTISLHITLLGLPEENTTDWVVRNLCNKNGHQQDGFYSEVSSLGFPVATALLCLTWPFCVSVCRWISSPSNSFYNNTNTMGSEPHPLLSVKLNYLYIGSISEHSLFGH